MGTFVSRVMRRNSLHRTYGFIFDLLRRIGGGIDVRDDIQPEDVEVYLIPTSLDDDGVERVGWRSFHESRERSRSLKVQVRLSGADGGLDSREDGPGDEWGSEVQETEAARRGGVVEGDEEGEGVELEGAFVLELANPSFIGGRSEAYRLLRSEYDVRVVSVENPAESGALVTLDFSPQGANFQTISVRHNGLRCHIYISVHLEEVLRRSRAGRSVMIHSSRTTESTTVRDADVLEGYRVLLHETIPRLEQETLEALEELDALGGERAAEIVEGAAAGVVAVEPPPPQEQGEYSAEDEPGSGAMMTAEEKNVKGRGTHPRKNRFKYEKWKREFSQNEFASDPIMSAKLFFRLTLKDQKRVFILLLFRFKVGLSIWHYNKSLAIGKGRRRREEAKNKEEEEDEGISTSTSPIGRSSATPHTSLFPSALLSFLLKRGEAPTSFVNMNYPMTSVIELMDDDDCSLFCGWLRSPPSQLEMILQMLKEKLFNIQRLSWVWKRKLWEKKIQQVKLKPAPIRGLSLSRKFQKTLMRNYVTGNVERRIMLQLQHYSALRTLDISFPWRKIRTLETSLLMLDADDFRKRWSRSKKRSNNTHSRRRITSASLSPYDSSDNRRRTKPISTSSTTRHSNNTNNICFNPLHDETETEEDAPYCTSHPYSAEKEEGMDNYSRRDGIREKAQELGTERAAAIAEQRPPPPPQEEEEEEEGEWDGFSVPSMTIFSFSSEFGGEEEEKKKETPKAFDVSSSDLDTVFSREVSNFPFIFHDLPQVFSSTTNTSNNSRREEDFSSPRATSARVRRREGEEVQDKTNEKEEEDIWKNIPYHSHHLLSPSPLVVPPPPPSSSSTTKRKGALRFSSYSPWKIFESDWRKRCRVFSARWFHFGLPGVLLDISYPDSTTASPFSLESLNEAKLYREERKMIYARNQRLAQKEAASEMAREEREREEKNVKKTKKEESGCMTNEDGLSETSATVTTTTRRRNEDEHLLFILSRLLKILFPPFPLYVYCARRRKYERLWEKKVKKKKKGGQVEDGGVERPFCSPPPRPSHHYNDEPVKDEDEERGKEGEEEEDKFESMLDDEMKDIFCGYFPHFSGRVVSIMSLCFLRILLRDVWRFCHARDFSAQLNSELGQRLLALGQSPEKVYGSLRKGGSIAPLSLCPYLEKEEVDQLVYFLHLKHVDEIYRRRLLASWDIRSEEKEEQQEPEGSGVLASSTTMFPPRTSSAAISCGPSSSVISPPPSPLHYYSPSSVNLIWLSHCLPCTHDPAAHLFLPHGSAYLRFQLGEVGGMVRSVWCDGCGMESSFYYQAIYGNVGERDVNANYSAGGGCDLCFGCVLFYFKKSIKMLLRARHPDPRRRVPFAVGLHTVVKVVQCCFDLLPEEEEEMRRWGRKTKKDGPAVIEATPSVPDKEAEGSDQNDKKENGHTNPHPHHKEDQQEKMVQISIRFRMWPAILHPVVFPIHPDHPNIPLKHMEDSLSPPSKGNGVGDEFTSFSGGAATRGSTLSTAHTAVSSSSPSSEACPIWCRDILPPVTREELDWVYTYGLPPRQIYGGATLKSRNQCRYVSSPVFTTDNLTAALHHHFPSQTNSSSDPATTVHCSSSLPSSACPSSVPSSSTWIIPPVEKKPPQLSSPSCFGLGRYTECLEEEEGEEENSTATRINMINNKGRDSPRLLLEVVEDKGKIKHLDRDGHCVICQLALYASTHFHSTTDSSRSPAHPTTRYAFPLIEKHSPRRTRGRERSVEKTIFLHQDEKNRVKKQLSIKMNDGEEGSPDAVEDEEDGENEKEEEDTSLDAAEGEDEEEEEEVEVEEEWWIGSFEKYIPRNGQEWEAHEAAMKRAQKDRQIENRVVRNKKRKSVWKKELQKNEQGVNTGEKTENPCGGAVTLRTWPDASFYQQHYKFPPYPRTRSIIIKTPCSHVFHQECFALWVERSTQFGTTFCPVCRQQLLVRNDLCATSLQTPASETVHHTPLGAGGGSESRLDSVVSLPPPPPPSPGIRHVHSSSDRMLGPVTSGWGSTSPSTFSEEALVLQQQTQEVGEGSERRMRMKNERVEDWSLIRSKLSLCNTLLALRSWENVRMRDELCTVFGSDSCTPFYDFLFPLSADRRCNLRGKSRTRSRRSRSSGGGSLGWHNRHSTGDTREEEEEEPSCSANRSQSRQGELTRDQDQSKGNRDNEESAVEEEEGSDTHTEGLEHFFDTAAWESEMEASFSSSNSSSMNEGAGFFGNEVLGFIDLPEESLQQGQRRNIPEELHEEDREWDISRVDAIYQHLNFNQIRAYEDRTKLANRRVLPPLISELDQYFTKRCFIPSVESEEGGIETNEEVAEEERRRDRMMNSPQGLFCVSSHQWDLAKRHFTRHLAYLASLRRKEVLKKVNMEELRVKIHQTSHQHPELHHNSIYNKKKMVRSLMNSAEEERGEEAEEEKQEEDADDVDESAWKVSEQGRNESSVEKENDDDDEKEDMSETYRVFARVREVDEVELTLSVPWSWIRWEEEEEKDDDDKRRKNDAGGAGGRQKQGEASTLRSDEWEKEMEGEEGKGKLSSIPTSSSCSCASFVGAAGYPFVDLAVMTVWTKNGIAYNPTQCASCEVIRAYGRRRTRQQIPQ